jgi:hypothetical protein
MWTDKLTGSVIKTICNGLVRLKFEHSYFTIGVPVCCQAAHDTKKHGGHIICDYCVSIILHVISLANCECAYTITLAINSTTDCNDMYLVSWGSVSSVWLSVTQHY